MEAHADTGLHVIGAADAASGPWREVVSRVLSLTGLTSVVDERPGSPAGPVADQDIVSFAATTSDPILVLPRRHPPTESHGGQSRLLVPIEPSGLERPVLRAWIERAERLGFGVDLLHVITRATAPRMWEGPGHHAEAWWAQIRRRYRIGTAALSIDTGDPADGILAAASRSELIMLFWRGDAAAGHAATLRRVIRGADKPLLLVRKPPASSADTGPTTGPIDIYSYQAWLFDLDGVLTKTADVHAAAWKEAFDQFLGEEGGRTGKVFEPFDSAGDYRRYVDGEPRDDGVRDFLAARGITLPEGAEGDPPSSRTVKGLGNRKNALVLAVLDSQGVVAYDGAVALVRALRVHGTPMAVVSASENTQAVLEAAGIADLFDARVDGHVVKERQLAGKPAPDSYLEGARMLNADPHRTVVVEDALAGVEAGRAGQFGLVVGVDHHDDADHHDYADELRSHGADVVVGDLARLLDDPATPG